MKLQYKDKEGKPVTTKEFIQRWKEGIKNITPIQQIQSLIVGSIIVLIGILWGLIFSIILKQWWLVIILIGSFIVSFWGLYGNWQKLLLLKKVEAQMKSFEIPKQPEQNKEVSYVN